MLYALRAEIAAPINHRWSPIDGRDHLGPRNRQRAVDARRCGGRMATCACGRRPPGGPPGPCRSPLAATLAPRRDRVPLGVLRRPIPREGPDGRGRGLPRIDPRSGGLRRGGCCAGMARSDRRAFPGVEPRRGPGPASRSSTSRGTRARSRRWEPATSGARSSRPSPATPGSPGRVWPSPSDSS